MIAVETRCRRSSRSFVCSRRRGSSCTGASSRVNVLPKNLISRLSQAGSQQQGEVPEALLSPVPCAQCRRWWCEKKQQTEGERERSHEQEYLSVNWQPEHEEEGDLYRRADMGGWTWTSWLMRLMRWRSEFKALSLRSSNGHCLKHHHSSPAANNKKMLPRGNTSRLFVRPSVCLTDRTAPHSLLVSSRLDTTRHEQTLLQKHSAESLNHSAE
jgi:hypothetical protein